MFIEIEGLYELEKAKKWGQAIALLNKKWCENKENADILLRLATESWYIMSNWEVLDLNNSEVNFEDVQKILMQTYNYFMQNHINNNKCLAMFGYMVNLFPNYFYADYDKNGELFLMYEKKGKDMINLAYKNEPQNTLFRLLYLRIGNKKLGKNESALNSDFKNAIQKLFPQNTEVEEYFREVLTN